MTRCASENPHCPGGLGYTPPAPLSFRIETPRLVLRPFELGDAPALFETIERTRSHLLPWMGWAETGHRSLAQTTEFVAQQVVQLTDAAALATKMVSVPMVDRTTGEIVGCTGYHDLRESTASVEVGYWVRGDRCRQGLCSEGVRHWLSWLLTPKAAGGMGLARVRIYCSSENRASARVCEKLGIRPEVMQRADFFVPGVGVTDRLGWGVLASEWDTQSHAPRA
jgi:RimJ/RimL family protein N-acetyltransferase